MTSYNSTPGVTSILLSASSQLNRLGCAVLFASLPVQRGLAIVNCGGALHAPRAPPLARQPPPPVIGQMGGLVHPMANALEDVRRDLRGCHAPVAATLAVHSYDHVLLVLRHRLPQSFLHPPEHAAKLSFVCAKRPILDFPSLPAVLGHGCGIVHRHGGDALVNRVFTEPRLHGKTQLLQRAGD